MTRTTGHILRMLGLLIEMAGILVMLVWNRTDGAGAPLPGSLSSHQVWTIVITGFVIWLVGSILFYWPRPGRNKSHVHRADSHELNL
ncbi:MAG: hypothetical protein ACLP7Q_05125 [Isosphaeraceae bacterium]|nr:hypothetical protein [Isosphaeraceae bacterium]